MTTAKRTSSKPSAKSEPKPNKPYVDLSKLRKTSLKRYKKHFNLDVKADSKTELLEAVGRHFAQMPVREADVAHDFYCFLRGLRNKHRAQQPHHQHQHAQAAKQHQQQQQHHQHQQQQHQQQQQQQQQAHPPQPAESHAQSPSPLHQPDAANSNANGDVKTNGNKSNGNNPNSHAAAHTPPASSTPTPSSPSPHAPGSSSALASVPAGGAAAGSDIAHPMAGAVTQPQSASSAMSLGAPTASVASGSGR